MMAYPHSFKMPTLKRQRIVTLGKPLDCCECVVCMEALRVRDFPRPDEIEEVPELIMCLSEYQNKTRCSRTIGSPCLKICMACLLQVKWEPKWADDNHYMQAECPTCRGLFRISRDVFGRLLNQQARRYGPLITRQLADRMFKDSRDGAVARHAAAEALNIVRVMENSHRVVMEHMAVAQKHMGRKLFMQMISRVQTKALHVVQSIRILALEAGHRLTVSKKHLLNHAVLVIHMKERCFFTAESSSYLAEALNNLDDFEGNDFNALPRALGPVKAFGRAPNFCHADIAARSLLFNHPGTHYFSNGPTQLMETTTLSDNPFHLYAGFDVRMDKFDAGFNRCDYGVCQTNLEATGDVTESFLWPRDPDGNMVQSGPHEWP